MRALYLGGPGPVKIGLTKDGLTIGEATPTPPPEFEYDTVLIGNTKGYLSIPALKTLGKWKVSVGLMGRGGTPLSTFIPWARNDAPLRLAQMRASLDPVRSLVVAKAFVSAKTGRAVPPSIRTRAALIGYEGRVDTEYWAERGIHRVSGFSKTLNRKATVPVNAAINYAEGVWSVRCRSIIAEVGLDPAVPFLHTASRDKDGFSYDVQELGRDLVDGVALTYAKEHPEAFVRDDWWVYRLIPSAARDLALRTCDALSQKVRYQGERVTFDSQIKRELQRLGVWLRGSSRSFEFGITRP
jgi:CRISPR/Cas system-associated endonuclease Cas1